MGYNYGKAFEQIFREDWKKSFPEGTIDRIYDTVGNYSNVRNVSDFICYAYPNIYYIECKTHRHGRTWNLKYLTQLEKLSTKVGVKGVIAGVVLWLVEEKRLFFLPIESVLKMERDGLKSFSTKMDFGAYDIVEIPIARAGRTYCHGDYRAIKERYGERETEGGAGQAGD